MDNKDTLARIQNKTLFSLITFLTCLSFLVIGYDNGVLGNVINQPAFQKTFENRSSRITGLIVALYDVGCFFGAVTTAVIGERLGRCRSMFTGAIVMIIGALLQSTSYSVTQIMIARVVSGVGMGLINSTAPVYQSEFSPKHSRGLYACAQLSTLNLGIFLAYWIGYGFAGLADSYAWRVPVILQCVFIIPIAVLSCVLPETPRWLIAHNRQDEARYVYTRLYGEGDEVDRIFRGIISAVTIEDEAQSRGFFSVLWHGDSIGSRHRFLIACAIQFFQQLGGINGIIYYAGTIFSESLGFDSHISALMSGFLFTWFFVASFIPWFLIDRVGRRPLFLWMISLMAALFAIQSALIRQIQDKTSVAHSAGIAAAAMLFLYIGAFTVGFQATVWVYPPEILPLRLRQKGTAIAASCNWIINFTVVQVTPVGISNIRYRYYIIYAVFNAAFVPIIYFFFPETKGLELEDVDRLFAKGDALLTLHGDSDGKGVGAAELGIVESDTQQKAG